MPQNYLVQSRPFAALNEQGLQHRYIAEHRAWAVEPKNRDRDPKLPFVMGRLNGRDGVASRRCAAACRMAPLRRRTNPLSREGAAVAVGRVSTG